MGIFNGLLKGWPPNPHKKNVIDKNLRCGGLEQWGEFAHKRIGYQFRFVHTDQSTGVAIVNLMSIFEEPLPNFLIRKLEHLKASATGKMGSFRSTAIQLD